MSSRGCIPASSVFQDDYYFATSSRGTPRKPLQIRFIIKQRQSDCKTEEDVATRENTSEEATLEVSTSRSTSFRGLPCWSVTGRRGRKTKQSAPTGRDNEVENADKMSPMVITKNTNEYNMNLDPRLHNAAESDTLTQNTNRMEVASSIGDIVETSTSRRKGKSIMISEVETSTLFVNSTHNAAGLEAGHQNGNMVATLSEKEDESCRELDIYELTTLKLAVNISKKDARAKRKGIMSPISSVSEISTLYEDPIQNISESATDDGNEKMACSSTKANKKRRRGLEIKNTSEGNGSSKEGYVCNICNESFSTYQALGGHTTHHTKHKSVLANTSKISSGQDGHDKESKPHQCSVCDKAFQMGHQLGGHMRAHFTGTLSSKRVKHNAQDHGSSSATARDKSPDGSSSQSANDIAPAAAASLSEDTAKNSDTTAVAAASSAAGSVTEEMFLPHYFDLNELPREGDTLAAASSSPSSSSSDTPAADDVMLDLALSL